MNTPAMPTAVAARAKTGTKARSPPDEVPCPPGCRTEWVASKMTGAPTFARIGSALMSEMSVVAEGNAAFSHEHVGITSAGNLGRHVGHVPGGKELALFDIDSAAGFCGGNQEIGLAAEKCRNLQNINRFRDQRALAWLMHVGEN